MVKWLNDVAQFTTQKKGSEASKKYKKNIFSINAALRYLRAILLTSIYPISTR